MEILNELKKSIGLKKTIISLALIISAVAALGVGVVNAAIPGKPTNVKAVAGDGTITLSWKAPVFTGGAALTIAAYKVVQILKNGLEVNDATVVNAPTTTATFTGLTNGKKNKFYVTAVNSDTVSNTSLNSNMVSAIPSKPKNIDIACMATAVAARESAMQTAMATYSAAITTAFTARASGLAAAWLLAGKTARDAAIKAAWKTFGTAKNTAANAFRSSKKNAWNTFGIAQKACNFTFSGPNDSLGKDLSF